MKNGWKRWIRGWSLIVILLSVLSVSGCSVSEEDGLQEVTEKVSQEPEVSQKDSGKSEDQEKPGQTEELMTLPGIGEAKAEKILRYREEHGAFRSIEDVMQIEGIKEGVFNKIKEDITI